MSTDAVLETPDDMTTVDDLAAQAADLDARRDDDTLQPRRAAARAALAIRASRMGRDADAAESEVRDVVNDLLHLLDVLDLADDWPRILHSAELSYAEEVDEARNAAQATTENLPEG